MSSQRYAPEFKDEAVRQVTEKGHSVPEVAARLGVSIHSLYKWVKAVSPTKNEQRSDELLDAKKEILKLRTELPMSGLQGFRFRALLASISQTSQSADSSADSKTTIVVGSDRLHVWME